MPPTPSRRSPMFRPVKTLLLALALIALAATSASAADVNSNAGGVVFEGGTATFQISSAWGPIGSGESEPTVNATISPDTAAAGADFGALAETVQPVACGAGACT